MPLLHKPSPRQVDAFLQSQSGCDFTYSAVGATARQPPAGYQVDHTRYTLGAGEGVFQRARAALQDWRQFGLGWVEAWPAEPPVEPGRLVAVVARSLGLWWLNACRVVYVIDEEGPVRRYGYAYGTLPAHAGTGEERFLVEWDRHSGEVSYDILAFSRPHSFLAKLGYVHVRRVQKAFGRGSVAAMLRAVGRGNGG